MYSVCSYQWVQEDKLVSSVHEKCFQDSLEEIKLLNIFIGFHSNDKKYARCVFSLFSDVWTLKGCHHCETSKVGGELQFFSSHSVREKLELHLIFDINIL